MDPTIEALLDRADSKFTLVNVASKRARQVNSYFNHLGDGLGSIVPPQVASTARKPLSIAFEEIAANKITYHLDDDGVEGSAPADGTMDGSVIDGAGTAGLALEGDEAVGAAFEGADGSAGSEPDPAS